MPFTPELGDNRDLAARNTRGSHGFSDCWLDKIILRGVDDAIATSKGMDYGGSQLFLAFVGGGTFGVDGVNIAPGFGISSFLTDLAKFPIQQRGVSFLASVVSTSEHINLIWVMGDATIVERKCSLAYFRLRSHVEG